MKFSIIINCYNTLPIIKKCVQSLLDTTDDSAEILLVNNYPPYPDVINYLGRYTHPRVKVLDPGRNLSHILGTQFAEQHASGEYLVRMDDDAVVLDNNWINAMYQALNQIPDLAYVGLPWQGIGLGGGNRVSTSEYIIEYADMVLFTCVMFKRDLWQAYFKIPEQGVYGNDDGCSAQIANQLGLKKAYLVSHPCLHLGRTAECDPLYGAWKVFYVKNVTRLDFAEWKSTLSSIAPEEVQILQEFGYPQDQINEIKGCALAAKRLRSFGKKVNHGI